MKIQTHFGGNRTGVESSPIESKILIKFVKKFPPDIKSNPRAIEKFRQSFIKEENNLGSVPIPLNLKGVVKTITEKIKGTAIEVFVDKLGERLAFERNGVRLYDLIKNKIKASSGGRGQLLKDVAHFPEEELEHFKIVCNCMKQLGADPTSQTPCACSVGISGEGLMKVIADPRTTVAQSLEALLTAELADNAGWELLIELAEKIEQPEKILKLFQQALKQEQDHLKKIKFYLQQEIMSKIGMKG